MALLDTIYEKNILPSNPPPSQSAAKVGVIYMIFAVGMLGEERRIGNDEIHPESERFVSLFSSSAYSQLIEKPLANDGMPQPGI